MREADASEKNWQSKDWQRGDGSAEKESQGGNEFAQDYVAAFEVRQEKKPEGALAFFAADAIDRGCEGAAREDESAPGLQGEDLLADRAAGLAGEFEKRVENPACGEEGDGRNKDASAVNAAIMRGDANFARGHWQIDFDRDWTTLRM